jgi:hypothetical protein
MNRQIRETQQSLEFERKTNKTNKTLARGWLAVCAHFFVLELVSFGGDL